MNDEVCPIGLGRKALDTMPYGVCLLDNEYRVVFNNVKMRQLLGLGLDKDDPALGMVFFDIKKVKNAGIEKLLRNILEEENLGQTVEVIYESMVNVVCHCLVTSAQVGDHFVLYAEDISQARRLRRHARQMFTAIEQAENLIIFTDNKGFIKYTNPKFREVTGYTHAELQGVTPRILKSDTVPEEVYKGLWATITAGQVWHGEFMNLTRDGRPFFVRVVISPVRNGGDKIIGYVSVQELVTEERLRKQELQATRGAYAALFNQAITPMSVKRMIYDDDGTPIDWIYVDVNEAWEQRMSKPKIEVIGRPVSELFPDIYDDSIDWFNIFGRVQRTGEPFFADEIYSEGLNIYWRIRVYRSVEGHVVTVMNDVTDQIVAKQQRVALAEAQSNFIAAVTHEVRTPITLISGFTQALAEMTWDAEGQRLMTLVVDQVKQIDRLTTDALDLMQMTTEPNQVVEHFEPVNMAYIALSCVEGFKRLARQKSLELTANTTVNFGEAIVNGHEQLLKRMMTSLIDNATKFTEPPGHITVLVQDAENGNGPALEIVVADEGIGIPFEYQAKVWDRFYQIDSGITRKYRGIGMGLAVVKEVVKLHGGRVSLESQPGIGTKIIVKLPK